MESSDDPAAQVAGDNRHLVVPVAVGCESCAWTPAGGSPSREACATCGYLPDRCAAVVEQCSSCGWRGDNLPSSPCCKCGAWVGVRPCRRRPRPGLERCIMHGAGSPEGRVAVRQHLAEAEVAKSIADVVVVPIDNPLQALADLAADAAAWKDHLADIVAQLEDQFRFTDDKGAEHLDARVALFERAMDRLQKYLSDWVRLGFEERALRLSEAQQDYMLDVLDAVLRRLGLDVDRPDVIEAVAVELDLARDAA